jgi:hypothetical protein
MQAKGYITANYTPGNNITVVFVWELAFWNLLGYRF